MIRLAFVFVGIKLCTVVFALKVPGTVIEMLVVYVIRWYNFVIRIFLLLVLCC